ncbi:hypothetical protein G6011_05963 [Alternaria panax]|uniref:Uncharacterized protein n=1 Tax=Alternaria panax TaxID=48097 RepID=A0AAD4FGR9_9PLEO|nr:hypothetical protein G6011_05963 [Alternaria panax]
MIYGLLGLPTLECEPADRQSFVDPDYSIMTKECYRRVAWKLLSECHDLKVFSMVLHSSQLAEDWPSWVPNWNEPRANPFQDFYDEDDKQNERATLVDVSETTIGEKQCVQISGLKVDTIDREVKEYASLGTTEDNVQIPKSMQASLRHLEKSCSH